MDSQRISTRGHVDDVPSTTPTHVVMLVGNNISVDTRVKKTAASLERMSLRVTLVGVSDAAHEKRLMGGVAIEKLAMRWEHRGAGREEPDPASLAVEPGHDVSLPWRTTVPVALDYIDAFVDAVVALEPDVIHAHDVHTIAIAHEAARRMREAGKDVPWIYDAHEYVAGLSIYGNRDVVERAGWLNLEQEFASSATAIITVSPALAQTLRARYPSVPDIRVVLNAPWAEDAGHGDEHRHTGIRKQLGLDEGAPLLVYSGVVTAARGLPLVVAAMPALEGVHLAIVSTTYGSRDSQSLVAQAAELGVADRVHLLPPVPPDRVIDFLASADVGLIPIKRFPSHDIALTNKLFEYVHAGLPVIVSDCPAQKEFVRREDIGAVHMADNVADFALASKEVLRKIDYFRANVRRPELNETYSWQRSEQELLDLYVGILGRNLNIEASSDFPDLTETESPQQPSGASV